MLSSLKQLSKWETDSITTFQRAELHSLKCAPHVWHMRRNKNPQDIKSVIPATPTLHHTKGGVLFRLCNNLKTSIDTFWVAHIKLFSFLFHSPWLQLSGEEYLSSLYPTVIRKVEALAVKYTMAQSLVLVCVIQWKIIMAMKMRKYEISPQQFVQTTNTTEPLSFSWFDFFLVLIWTSLFKWLTSNRWFYNMNRQGMRTIYRTLIHCHNFLNSPDTTRRGPL